MVKLVSKRRHTVRVTRSRCALRRRARSKMIHPRELNKALGAKTNVQNLFRKGGFETKSLGKMEEFACGDNKNNFKETQYGEPLIIEKIDTRLPEWHEKKEAEKRADKAKRKEGIKVEGVNRVLLNKEDRQIITELIQRFGDNIHLMSLDSKSNFKLYNASKLKKLYKLYQLEKSEIKEEPTRKPTQEMRRKVDPCTERLFRKVPKQYRNVGKREITTVDISALLAGK